MQKRGPPPPLSAVLGPEIAPVSELVECLPTPVFARIRKSVREDIAYPRSTLRDTMIAYP